MNLTRGTDNTLNIQNDIFDLNSDNIEQTVSLFNVLSNEDAIRIFLYAEKGIKNSSHVIKEMGITSKRYYSRLKGLLEVGLLEKIDGVYQYTAYGKIVHELGLYLFGIMDNYDRIKILHQLSKSDGLSKDERSEISDMISRNIEYKPMLNSIIEGVPQKEIKKIVEYKDLIKILVEDIGKAKKIVLLASNYVEADVVNAQILASRKGVQFKVLLSTEAMANKINKIKLILSPKILLNLHDFVESNRNNDDWFREAELPFSFCIIDDQISIFELPSIGSEFSIAFYVKDYSTSKRFSSLFEKIWNNSGLLTSDSITEFLWQS